jgi:hypothetical protein
MALREGQEVKYNGQITHIETIYDDETCRIKNPDWDWDTESECVAAGIDYDVPFWISVNIKDLS